MKMITKIDEALKNPALARFLKIKIKDHVPEEIQTLTNLEELYLEGEFSTLDIDFSNLSKLKLIALNSVRLEAFPKNALLCPKLIHLKILSGEISRMALPLEIISPLQTLTVKDNKLTSLPLELSQLRDLTELNLSGNQLSELPMTFSELKKLKRLNIDQNKFERLSEDIKKCPSLMHLSCDGNPFSEEEKFRIQREFHITPH